MVTNGRASGDLDGRARPVGTGLKVDIFEQAVRAGRLS